MLLKRQKLITEIEQSLSDKYHSTNRLIADVMRFGHARTSMHISDIPNIEAVLNSITGAEQINLLIHSPGGDGTITEKIVDICRAHLTGANRKLRVIVPNIAKSAATILALGTDEIIMGYTSELGPIDPQVPVNVHDAVGFCVRFCRNCRSDKKGLNIPFTDEMENQIGFAKKTAITLLNKCMLAPVHKEPTTRKKNAEAIAQKLLSKELFPVHGHYINGQVAKDMGLQVELLDKDDPSWAAQCQGQRQELGQAARDSGWRQHRPPALTGAHGTRDCRRAGHEPFACPQNPCQLRALPRCKHSQLGPRSRRPRTI